MRFIDNLYCSGYTNKEIDSLKKKINKSKSISKLYLITLPIFDDGILEIYEYQQLLTKFYKDSTKDIVVIGFAHNYDEAKDAIVSIIDNMYKETGKIDIVQYLHLQ